LRETECTKVGRGGGEEVDCLDEWCGKSDEEAVRRKKGLFRGECLKWRGTYERMKAAKVKMKRIITCGP
jgi:hypothetical protein